MTQKAAVQSVDRALRLLWAIHDHPGITLTELAVSFDLLPSTVLRLLATLQQHRLITRDPHKGYRIGVAAVALGHSADHWSDLVSQCQPALTQLAGTVKELAELAVLDGHSVLHLAGVDGAARAGEPVIMHAPIGRRDDNLNATALGKVFLAYADDAVAGELIGDLAFTRTATRTITDPARLRRHLAIVRSHGYATSINENTDQARGIAAPIHTSGGATVAAISINGPAHRLRRSRLQAMVPDLLRAANRC